MKSELSSLERTLMGQQFFFMHIPKTAGTTLIQILEQQFDEQEIAKWLYPFHLFAPNAQSLRSHRYFHGHIEYDLMCSFLRRPAVTITMLRDPVERYLSQFGNHKRVAGAQIPDWTKEVYHQFQQTSLSQFISKPPPELLAESRSWQNKQARMLTSPSASDHSYLGSTEASANRIEAPSLEQAKKRLDQIAFFGLTERFQDSLFLLAYTFGWTPHVAYQTVNNAPTGQRPSRVSLTDDVLNEIERLNLIDRQLYEHAERLFETRYQQMCSELVDFYGSRGSAHSKPPLSSKTLFDLLDRHYRRRFMERSPLSTSAYLTFDSKFSGHNWQVREKDLSGDTFRWSGPGCSSTLDFRLVCTSDVKLRVGIFMAISEPVLESLITKVNGEPIPMKRVDDASGTIILEGYVKKEQLKQRLECVRVTFEIDHTVRPRDVIPDSQDERLLGVAFRWVELEQLNSKPKRWWRRFRRQTNSTPRHSLDRGLDLSTATTSQLEFSKSKKPAVSIVMVTHGCRQIVCKTLTTLLNYTESIYELIVVDSASPDDTASWLNSNVRGVRLIRSKTNVGYVGGSNLGAECAKAPLLIFMNPDVFVTEGWLDPLLTAIKHPLVGIVGPQLRYPNGVLQAAGSLVFRTGLTARYGDGDPNPDSPSYRYPRGADYVSGACLMIRRELFQRCGGFDPVFGLGYYEDVDLCFKVGALGLSVQYAPISVVHHVRDACGGSRTLATTVSRNQKLFVQRWEQTLRQRPESNSSLSAILTARDVRAPLRILLVGPGTRRAVEFCRYDNRLAITAIGCEDSALSAYVESIPSTDDWDGWFQCRQSHYDLVIGTDPAFDSLIDLTQPRARRVSDCDPVYLETLASTSRS